MTEHFKATIVQIGSVDEQGHTYDWIFDMHGHPIELALDEDGQQLHAGYTVAELRQIAEGR